jgi:hypothetical protein
MRFLDLPEITRLSRIARITNKCAFYAIFALLLNPVLCGKSGKTKKK